MAVFNVHKTRDFTVMSNYHLRDRELSCKACGLLSKMLSLPDTWDYTTRGLAAICKDGVDSISSALRELEQRGYLVRTQVRDERGRIADEYLTDRYDRSQLDELVEIMVEVAMNRSRTIKIGRDAEYPTEYVQDRFRKLNSMHIEKVMDGIKENTTRVFNTKAYLMAALFNVGSTIDNHYAMLVNHDFYGG